jgi:hypothetical protein
MITLFKRPKYISVVCVIGIIWSLFSFLYVFAPSVKKVGAWYPAVLGLLVALRFISLIGVWHMKKWGVLLFIVSVFCKLFLSVVLNELSTVEVAFTAWIGVVLSAWIGISLLPYFGRMDDNL